MGFFNIGLKFLIDRVHHAEYWNFGPLASLQSRPQAQMTIGLKLKRHGSTAAAMPTVMLGDPGSNPGVNHGCMYLSRRTNVFCLVLSHYVVYRQLGKKPVNVMVFIFKTILALKPF
jgi:hypothetical protein